MESYVSKFILVKLFRCRKYVVCLEGNYKCRVAHSGLKPAYYHEQTLKVYSF